MTWQCQIGLASVPSRMHAVSTLGLTSLSTKSLTGIVNFLTSFARWLYYTSTQIEGILDTKRYFLTEWGGGGGGEHNKYEILPVKIFDNVVVVGGRPLTILDGDGKMSVVSSTLSDQAQLRTVEATVYTIV